MFSGENVSLRWIKKDISGDPIEAQAAKSCVKLEEQFELYMAISLMVYDFIAYHRHIAFPLLCWLNDPNEMITHWAQITKTMVFVDFI